jgi:hypothetical protein
MEYCLGQQSLGFQPSSFVSAQNAAGRCPRRESAALLKACPDRRITVWAHCRSGCHRQGALPSAGSPLSSPLRPQPLHLPPGSVQRPARLLATAAHRCPSANARVVSPLAPTDGRAPAATDARGAATSSRVLGRCPSQTLSTSGSIPAHPRHSDGRFSSTLQLLRLASFGQRGCPVWTVFQHCMGTDSLMGSPLDADSIKRHTKSF